MASIHPYNTPSGERRFRVFWREDGKQKTKSFARMKVAEAYKRDREAEERGEVLPQLEAPQTFGKFSGLTIEKGKVELTGDGWFERYRQSVRPSSFDRRRDVRKHLEEYLPLTFDRITAAMVEDHVSTVAKLHPRQAKFLLETMKMIVRAAQLRQRVHEDILKVKPPRYEGRAQRFLTVEEVERLAEKSDEPHLLLFAAYTGLRQGECIALKDHDVTADYVAVEHTFYKGQLGRVKTKAGRRKVPLSKRAKLAVSEQRMKRPHGTDVLFCAPRGGHLHRHNFDKRFREWRDAAGMPDVVFHDLRHTYASLMIRAGVHPKELQELMGHETFRLTMDLYGHLFDGQREAAIERLDVLLGDTVELG